MKAASVSAVAGGGSVPSRSFPTDEVLTISTGRLVAHRHIDAVYDLLNYMTGDSLFTHQLPRAERVCGPVLLAQHPILATVEVPESFGGLEDVQAWVAEQIERLGPSFEVTPLVEWDSQNPIEELADMKG